MKKFSANGIRALYLEYKTLKRYVEKLMFFDLHFELIPFSFPAFDPELLFFFENEKIASLTAIYKGERNNPALSEARFSFDADYRFCIKPTNSNSSIYSTYILSKFLSAIPDFEKLIRQQESGIAVDNPYDRPVLEKANRIINQIEYKLKNEYDKSLTQHCMAVFFKGFTDSFAEQVTIPDKKRKFIELYLYAQGILYAKYLEAVRKHYVKSLAISCLPAIPSSHLQNKILLLRDSGAIDQFEKKYSNLGKEDIEYKMSALICLITGEDMTRQDLVRELFLSTGNAENQEIIYPPHWKRKSLK